MFDAAWTEYGKRRSERFAVRLEPPAGEGAYCTYDIPGEFAVMQALSNTPVPVPSVRWLETDESILGGRFFVMARLDGRVPPDDPPFTVDGWVLELSERDRARLSENGLKALAQVHEVDWRALGLDFLDRRQDGAPGVEQRLAYYARYFEFAARGEANPMVEAGFEWLRQNRPPEPDRPSLLWGDSRTGNMVFADDLSVAGLLDWEMVSVGAPEMDLGWWLATQRLFTEALGVPLPAGIADRERTIALYEEYSRRRVKNIHYYEVLGALEVSVMLHRVGAMMISGGRLPADSPIKLNNQGTQVLASLLGLPALQGRPESYIGKR